MTESKAQKKPHKAQKTASQVPNSMKRLSQFREDSFSHWLDSCEIHEDIHNVKHKDNP